MKNLLGFRSLARPLGSPRISASQGQRFTETCLSPRRFISDINTIKAETAESQSSEDSARLTGVLDYSKSKEVLIFFDNLYPRWLAKLAYTKTFGYFMKSFN
ncbi:hypothetical protein OXX69_013294, partial [Metschnikowia pulcherrima]